MKVRNSKIIVRTRMIPLFKSQEYVIRLNGIETRELNNNHEIEFMVHTGRHCIEIGNNKSFKSKDMIITPGQIKVIEIVPSYIYPFSFGFLFGMLLMMFLIQLTGVKISNLLGLIPLGILFILISKIQKRQFTDSYDLTISNL